MDRRSFLTRLYNTSQPGGSNSLGATPNLAPYSGPWNRNTAAHLLRRTILAPTVQELQSATDSTIDAVVDQLLTPAKNLPAPPRFVNEWLKASIVPWNFAGINPGVFYNEMRRWWCGLMLNSGISLTERMTLFWHNHFATNEAAVQDGRFVYQHNQLLRQHSLGNFKELVRLVTIDKAMLDFLDGRYNKSDYRLQENYARELQELFTIGITDNNGNPNYTQQDVVEAARALTGWDWLGDHNAGVVCNALTGHDIKDKIVYGKTITGNIEGTPELAALLNIIFEKEETARYVVRKLYRFFVYTEAPLTPVTPISSEVEEHIIAPLAAQLRQSGWEISIVLRVLLSSQHFYDSEVIAAHIKSPVDHLVGTARALRTEVISGDQFDYLMQSIQLRATRLGMELLAPPGVQGWQFYRPWISTSTLPQRRADTDALIDGTNVSIVDMLNPIFTGPIYRNGQTRLNVLAYAKQFPSFADDPEQLSADIAQHLLAYPASQKTLKKFRDALLQGQPAYEWAGTSDQVKETRLRSLLKTVMRTPNYQLM